MNQSDPDFGQPEIPEKVVTDYSPEELAAFREDFAPSARHFRKRSFAANSRRVGSLARGLRAMAGLFPHHNRSPFA